MSNYLRWGLTVALLYEVWTHSHWSVALSLTLMFVGTEIQQFVQVAHLGLTKEAVKVLREHIEGKDE